MTLRPIETHGILRSINGQWTIALDTSDAAFAEGMEVRLVLWDDRDPSARSEVEQIAITQQLDPAIVALALSAEGSLIENALAKSELS